ncbi:MAG: TIGR01212 family radical SAM protein [Calditrichaeota bacterium]|nr:MAG: TIGR01212 family radical SAM protein [Calditrichota bacterium]MBL1207294.1 TIGR01212 family radical SAM protein [Calditrichota bacterium]NOG47126.1 TIGR01212 family radical SAM protein [Calditrichota bacterium]
MINIKQNWNNHRFYPISQYYQKIFKEKVYKVSVSVAETCPNRQNLKMDTTCIFCDEWGSAAYHLDRDKSLIDQIKTNRDKIRKRYRAKKFLVYFQSYTNTFDRVTNLEKRFKIALEQEDIVGLVLGTRPDCLPKRLMPMLRELKEKTFIQIELGVQSFDDKQMHFLKRGHSAECSVDAIKKVYAETGLKSGVHLMFGLPDESDEQLIETAILINSLPVDTVKLHNLHVLVNTPLADLYHQNKFAPVSLEEYARRVVLFLRHLSPDVAVNRLTAVANRWDELVAPAWAKEKMRPVQYIEDQMALQDVLQGAT